MLQLLDMMKKRGFYLEFDLILALVIIGLGLFILTKVDVTSSPPAQTQSYSEQTIKILSEKTMGTLDQTYLNALSELVEEGTIQNDYTIAKQITLLLIKGEIDLARNLSITVIDKFIPNNYGYSFIVHSNNEDLLISERSTPKTEVVSISKAMITGLQQSKPIFGNLAQINFLGPSNYSNSKYFYFGGFTGQGNIDMLLSGFPIDAVFNGIYIEGFFAANATILINNTLCDQMPKSNGNLINITEMNISKINLSINCLKNLNTKGPTLITFNFSDAYPFQQHYIGGGFIRIDFITSYLLNPLNQSTYRKQLYGVDGLINIYDSLNVPGQMRSIKAHLHINNSMGNEVFLTIGNTTIWRNDSIGEYNATIENITIGPIIDAELGFTIFNKRSIPIRMAIRGLNVTGSSDVVLTTDLSNSMQECMNTGFPPGVNDEYFLINYSDECNCSDSGYCIIQDNREFFKADDIELHSIDAGGECLEWDLIPGTCSIEENKCRKQSRNIGFTAENCSPSWWTEMANQGKDITYCGCGCGNWSEWNETNTCHYNETWCIDNTLIPHNCQPEGNGFPENYDKDWSIIPDDYDYYPEDIMEYEYFPTYFYNNSYYPQELDDYCSYYMETPATGCTTSPDNTYESNYCWTMNIFPRYWNKTFCSPGTQDCDTKCNGTEILSYSGCPFNNETGLCTQTAYQWKYNLSYTGVASCAYNNISGFCTADGPIASNQNTTQCEYDNQSESCISTLVYYNRGVNGTAPPPPQEYLFVNCSDRGTTHNYVGFNFNHDDHRCGECHEKNNTGLCNITSGKEYETKTYAKYTCYGYSPAADCKYFYRYVNYTDCHFENITGDCWASTTPMETNIYGVWTECKYANITGLCTVNTTWPWWSSAEHDHYCVHGNVTGRCTIEGYYGEWERVDLMPDNSGCAFQNESGQCWASNCYLNSEKTCTGLYNYSDLNLTWTDYPIITEDSRYVYHDYPFLYYEPDIVYTDYYWESYDSRYGLKECDDAWYRSREPHYRDCSKIQTCSATEKVWDYYNCTMWNSSAGFECVPPWEYLNPSLIYESAYDSEPPILYGTNYSTSLNLITSSDNNFLNTTKKYLYFAFLINSTKKKPVAFDIIWEGLANFSNTGGIRLEAFGKPRCFDEYECYESEYWSWHNIADSGNRFIETTQTGNERKDAPGYFQTSCDSSGNPGGGGYGCNNDYSCDFDETCASCPDDCCPGSEGPDCGNNICESGMGEDCGSCPDDCCPGGGIECTLSLTPETGEPEYTVTATVNDPSCRVCDNEGCYESDCYNDEFRQGSGTFSAPDADGTYEYTACPGDATDTINVITGGGGSEDCINGIDDDDDFLIDCNDPDCSGDPNCICSYIDLTPESGSPLYTITASVDYGSCKICDYLGCDGSDCQGVQKRTGSGTFSAPDYEDTFGYYSCPGEGYNTIEVITESCTEDDYCDINSGENTDNCPQDCSCGDSECDSTEDCSSCKLDCGTCSSTTTSTTSTTGTSGGCGDYYCDTSSGEDSIWCSDCYCGDAICDNYEDCGFCPEDCGYCEYSQSQSSNTLINSFKTNPITGFAISPQESPQYTPPTGEYETLWVRVQARGNGIGDLSTDLLKLKLSYANSTNISECFDADNFSYCSNSQYWYNLSNESNFQCRQENHCWQEGIADCTKCDPIKVNLSINTNKQFVNDILGFSGNRIAPVVYGTTLANCSPQSFKFYQDQSALNGLINDYYADCGSTCVSCAIQKGIDLHQCKTWNSSAPKKYYQIAYGYYEEPYLLNEMKDRGAIIYDKTNISFLLANLTRYEAILFEDALLNNTGDSNQIASLINIFTTNGGIVIFSGRLFGNQNQEVIGINTSGDPNTRIANATILTDDLIFNVTSEESIQLENNYSITNIAAQTFKTIGVFDDDRIGLASWEYGEGHGYFIASVNISNEINYQERLLVALDQALLSQCNILKQFQKKYIVLMTDGESNFLLNGTAVINLTIAAEETIEKGREACEDYNITIYSVAFGNDSGYDTLNKTAQANKEAGCNGRFFYALDSEDLLHIYNTIAVEINFFRQEVASPKMEGDIQLLPDSYIEVIYTPENPSKNTGEVYITREELLPDCTSDIAIKGSSVIASELISYSGAYWTSYANINNHHVFNLTDFNNSYLYLGDPFKLIAPANYLTLGDNNIIEIQSGFSSTYQDVGGCSNANKIIYTSGIKSSFSLFSQVKENRTGCTWFINLEGDIRSVPIPSNYSGDRICNYTNSSQYGVDYTSSNVLDSIVYTMLTELDFDDDSQVDFDFTQFDLEASASMINRIPYMWGPALFEVRVWR